MEMNRFCFTHFKYNVTYLIQGPVISGQLVDVQNSDIVPYVKLTCSNSAIAAM